MNGTRAFYLVVTSIRFTLATVIALHIIYVANVYSYLLEVYLPTQGPQIGLASVCSNINLCNREIVETTFFHTCT